MKIFELVVDLRDDNRHIYVDDNEGITVIMVAGIFGLN